MSNQIVNPIIQTNTEDTLHDCGYSLEFLSESIHPLLADGMSVKAKHGFQVLLDCVIQAIQFETCRTSPNQKLSFVSRLSDFEQHLVKGVCKELGDKDEAILVAPTPSEKH